MAVGGAAGPSTQPRTHPVVSRGPHRRPLAQTIDSDGPPDGGPSLLWCMWRGGGNEAILLGPGLEGPNCGQEQRKSTGKVMPADHLR